MLASDTVLRADTLAAFAENAVHLYASEDLDDTLRRITYVTRNLVPACDLASVCVVADESLATHAQTDTLALDADRLQYDVGQGPCIDAVQERGIVYSPDTD